MEDLLKGLRPREGPKGPPDVAGEVEEVGPRRADLLGRPVRRVAHRARRDRPDLRGRASVRVSPFFFSEDEGGSGVGGFVSFRPRAGPRALWPQVQSRSSSRARPERQKRPKTRKSSRGGASGGRLRPGQEKGDSTSLQRGCSARARSKEKRSCSRSFRGMITRPKISRNEWKTTEIRAFEVGNFAPFSCPG